MRKEPKDPLLRGPIRKSCGKVEHEGIPLKRANTIMSFFDYLFFIVLTPDIAIPAFAFSAVVGIIVGAFAIYRIRTSTH